MSSWPSPRLILMKDVVFAPACSGSEPAWSTDGANGFTSAQFVGVTRMLLVVVLSIPWPGVSAQPVSSALPSCGLQSPATSGVASSGGPSGLVRIERAPPFRFSSRRLNGTWGWSTNLLWIWPDSETSTSPTSLIRRPAPSMKRKSFHGLAAVGRPGVVRHG